MTNPRVSFTRTRTVIGRCAARDRVRRELHLRDDQPVVRRDARRGNRDLAARQPDRAARQRLGHDRRLGRDHRRRAERVPSRDVEADLVARRPRTSAGSCATRRPADRRALAALRVAAQPAVRERDRRAPVHVPGSAVTTWPTTIVPRPTGGDVFTGGPTTTPVGFDAAVREPSAFVAVTRTRIRKPTSALVEPIAIASCRARDDRAVAAVRLPAVGAAAHPLVRVRDRPVPVHVPARRAQRPRPARRGR